MQADIATASTVLLIFLIVNGYASQDAYPCNAAVTTLGSSMRKLTKELELMVHPIKKVAQASFKVAAFARDLYASTTLPDWMLGHIAINTMYNDQACMAII